MLVGLAGVLWALTAELSSPVDTNLTLALFLMFAVLFDALRLLGTLLMRRNGEQATRFHLATDAFGPNRPIVLFMAGKEGILAWLFHYCSDGPFITRAGICIYGLLAAVSSLAFVASYWPLPLPNRRGRGAAIIVPTLLLVLVLLEAALAVYIVPRATLSIVHPVRVAACIAIALQLVGVFLNISPTSPLIASMVQLRRSVLLGHISLEAAVDEFELIAVGRRASHLVQGRVGQIIEIIDRAREHHRRTDEILSSIATIEGTPDEIMSWATKKTAAIQLLTGVRDKMIATGALVQEARVLNRALYRYISLFKLESTDVVELLSSITDALDKLIVQGDDTYEKLNSVGDKFAVRISLPRTKRTRDASADSSEAASGSDNKG